MMVKRSGTVCAHKVWNHATAAMSEVHSLAREQRSFVAVFRLHGTDSASERGQEGKRERLGREGRLGNCIPSLLRNQASQSWAWSFVEKFFPSLIPPLANPAGCPFPVMQMGKTIAVDVVRKIFEWRADGWSLLEIGRQFQKSKCWSHYVLQHYSEEIE